MPVGNQMRRCLSDSSHKKSEKDDAEMKLRSRGCHKIIIRWMPADRMLGLRKQVPTQLYRYKDRGLKTWRQQQQHSAIILSACAMANCHSSFNPVRNGALVVWRFLRTPTSLRLSLLLRYSCSKFFFSRGTRSVVR